MRWKEHFTEENRVPIRVRHVRVTVTSDVTHSPYNAGKEDSQGESLDQEQPDDSQGPEQCRIKLAPRFSDTDTTAEPTAEISTKKKNSQTESDDDPQKPQISHNQPNHCPDGIRHKTAEVSRQ